MRGTPWTSTFTPHSLLPLLSILTPMSLTVRVVIHVSQPHEVTAPVCECPSTYELYMSWWRLGSCWWVESARGSQFSLLNTLTGNVPNGYMMFCLRSCLYNKTSPTTYCLVRTLTWMLAPTALRLVHNLNDSASVAQWLCVAYRLSCSQYNV